MSSIDHGVENLVHPASAIEAIVEHLAEVAYQGPDRRDSARRSLIVSVTAVPVDEAFRPTGDAFMGITRDISKDGISLIHHEPVTAKYLALNLPAGDGQEMRVVMEVLRCQRVGPFCDIAGRFVTKTN